jgi:hypothetical protein
MKEKSKASALEIEVQGAQNQKPTPGPWDVKREGRRGLRIMDGAHKHKIALLGATGSNVPWLEQKADAHLIAASPELLESLKGLLCELRNYFPGIEIHVETAAGLKAEYLCAVAAIAKAEGR